MLPGGTRIPKRHLEETPEIPNSELLPVVTTIELVVHMIGVPKGTDKAAGVPKSELVVTGVPKGTE